MVASRSISGERVGVLGVGGQHLTPGGERDGPRLQLVLLQVGHARQKRRRLRPLQHLPLNLEDGGQAGPGAALLVDRRQDLGDPLALGGNRQQLLQQPPGPLVVGGGLDDPFQQIESAPPTLSSRPARRSARRNSSSGTSAADAKPTRVPSSASRFGPALPRRVEPFQRAVGAQVGRIELQHLLVRLEGVVGIGQRRLVKLGDLRQQIEPLAPVERRQLTDIEQRPQLGPALAFFIEPRQRPEGAHVHRLRGQDLRVDLLRFRRPPRLLLLQLGDDHQEVTPQVSIRVVPAAARSLSLSSPVTPAAVANPSSASRFGTSVGSISNSARAGPVGLGWIVERTAVERAELLQPIDPLAQRVGDGQQDLVGLGQLGGVLRSARRAAASCGRWPRAPGAPRRPGARGRRWPAPNTGWPAPPRGKKRTSRRRP